MTLSGTHLFIYMIGILLSIFIFNLYISKNIYFDNSNNPFMVENLEVPSVSSSSDVSTGSSELYGWGYTPITKNKDRKPVSRKCPSCENTYIDPIDLCVSCNGGDKDCRFADITKNVDIDKYVLKSSVPPCPDMSEYAKKYQIPPFPFNKDEWIRKNEIPPCPVYPNMYEYIKKSELQSLQCECGRYKESQCPIAPVCPICPEQTKVVEKIIYQDRPSSISQYSQNGGYWTPKLSEMTEGFNSNM